MCGVFARLHERGGSSPSATARFPHFFGRLQSETKEYSSKATSAQNARKFIRKALPRRIRISWLKVRTICEHREQIMALRKLNRALRNIYAKIRSINRKQRKRFLHDCFAPRHQLSRNKLRNATTANSKPSRLYFKTSNMRCRVRPWQRDGKPTAENLTHVIFLHI